MTTQTDTAPLSAPHRKHERIFLLPPVMHDGEYVVTWCDIDPTDNGEGQQYVRFDAHNTIVGEAVTALSARVAELEAVRDRARSEHRTLADLYEVTLPEAREERDRWKDRATQAEAERDELRIENDALSASAGANQEVIDRIADAIGIPHDRELVAVEFSRWLSASQAREAGMREALEPFSAIADHYGDAEDDQHDPWSDTGSVPRLRLGHYRAARTALLSQPAQDRIAAAEAFIDMGRDAGLLVDAIYDPDAHGPINGDVEAGETVHIDSALGRKLRGRASSAGLLTTETTEVSNG
ncbi:hypothetical protein [Azospirillum brasilense]|uniref:hypothetical protein n=1 Tax=Azospirillum brasilense TaxID=192 RepID=UPI000E6990D4|nr:hypothetical protein [Azospirillum brasilense]NUB24287.1 hypothetical protein [Azospirillum brasilense]NUB30103.1 hypothetical protein [Azospirillum brasilense]RIW04961.1 hypothetical protein D2T81_08995 [Azospirillum brasilense]